MFITHEIQMDVMGRAGRCDAPIRVMQDDRYCRNLKISLLKDGVPMAIVPQSTAEGAEVTALVRFSKSDGTGGNYDTLPDGTAATLIDGNTVTVALAPQVLTSPGDVQLAVALIDEEVQLHTFAIQLVVERNPGIDVKSEDYTNMRAYLRANGWAPDRVLATDEKGRVQAVSAKALKLSQTAELDFSGWDEGYFTETLDDGTVVEYTVVFDESGEKATISNGTASCTITFPAEEGTA